MNNYTWISASAGTGKTKVLIDRIFDLLMNGAEPSSIVCLTFTKSAAHEMMVRLQKLLLNYYFNHNKFSHIIQNVINGKNPVRIQTIHSFCHSLLKNSAVDDYYWSNVSFIEDQESIIRSILMDIKHDFKNIVPYINEKKLVNIITQIIIKGKPLEILDLNAIVPDKPKLDEYPKELKNIVETYKAKELYNNSIIQNLMEGNVEILFTKKGEIKSAVQKSKLYEDFPDVAELINQWAQDILDCKYNENAQLLMQVSDEIIQTAKTVSAIYDKQKKDKGWADYNDLIINCKSVLTDPQLKNEILYRLDSSINHLLVDEAQDTNAEQWEIIKLITGNFLEDHTKQSSLFVVGDFKQSIYSFQGAQPFLFQELKDFFRLQAKKAGYQWNEVELIKSYRTLPNILALVDQVFNSEDIRLPVKHLPTRTDHKGIVKISKLIPHSLKSNPAEIKLPHPLSVDHHPSTILANKIAEKVQQLLNSNKFIPSRNRAIQPSDILILLQRRGELIGNLINALETKNIKVDRAEKINIRHHQAIEELLYLLKAIINPYDDLNLLSLLAKKDIFSAITPHQPIWDQLPTIDPSTYHKLAFYRNCLGMPPSQLIFRLTSIEEVIAASYEHDDIHSLVEYLENAQTLSTSGTSNNNLRIMSIHQSKGLQAPIVILADSNQPPLNDSGVLWVPSFLWYDKFKIPAVEQIRNKINSLKLSEWHRLLYVAITRAEDELHLCGWESPRQFSGKTWYELVRNVACGTERDLQGEGRYARPSPCTLTPHTRA